MAFIADRQGTTLAAVHPSGVRDETAAFFGRNVFGTLEGGTGTGSSSNPETGFTGASTPNQTGGFTYLRNRWYDPQSGRFLTQDPIGLAGGVNLYAYAGNNPVSFSDPYGLSPCRKALRRMAFICSLVEAGGSASSTLNPLDKRFPDLPNAPGRAAGEVSTGAANNIKTGQGFSTHNPPTGSGHNPPYSGVSSSKPGSSLEAGIEAAVAAMPLLVPLGGIVAAVAGVVMAIDDLLPEPELGTNPRMCQVERCDGVQEAR